MEGERGETLTVMGTDNEQSLLNLTDKEGQKISTKDGYYITSLAAYLCGWKTGDRVTLYNPVFDSCWKKKSLYPLYLLGCSDFYRCFEL